MVESVVAHISDMFPRHLYKTKGRMVLTGVLCCLWFAMGLSMVSRGGMYIFQLYDHYSASGMVLLWACFWECIAIGWFFGSEKFNDAIELMIGYRVNRWFHICWKYITPLLTAGIFGFQVIGYKPLKYKNEYEYPLWAQCFGLMLALVSMCCIPLYAIGKLLTLKGPIKERYKKAIIPKLRTDQLSTKWMRKEDVLLISQKQT